MADKSFKKEIKEAEALAKRAKKVLYAKESSVYTDQEIKDALIYLSIISYGEVGILASGARSARTAFENMAQARGIEIN